MGNTVPFWVSLLLTFSITSCTKEQPSSGLLPLQMDDGNKLLVAAEVHFFASNLDLEPLQQELAKLEDYLVKKRYRYVAYEPTLDYDVADDFIHYSSGLSLNNMTQSEIEADEAVFYEPQRFENEQEYQSLRIQLADYFSMVEPYKNAMWQLKKKKQQHLDEIERLEKVTEVNFNSVIKRDNLKLAPYRFISSPFVFKKSNKLGKACNAGLYENYNLLESGPRLDPQFCWYLQLPNPIFSGTEVELKHISLFKSFIAHYELINDDSESAISTRLAAAEQTFKAIEVEAVERFKVKESDLERLHELEGLLDKAPSARSVSEKSIGSLRALRFTKLHKMVKRYKAAMTLTYLFNSSFESKMAGVDGRFVIPKKARFMLVYGLYGPSIEQAKEYFWFVDMKQALSGFDNVKLMTLPEKPKDESLTTQLDSVMGQ